MKTFLRISVFAFLLLAGFMVGFAWQDISRLEAPSGDALSALVSGRKASATPTEVFENNYQIILSDSRQDVEPSELKHAAMQGLFASLGDPYTSFLPPIEAENFSLETTGNFVGIGARLTDDPLGAKIVNVFSSSPAEAAGVKLGDTIIGVDGEDVSGKTVDQIVSMIRGEENTIVRLKIMRQGAERPTEVRVRRQQIILPTAEGKRLTDTSIGYVNVTTFAENTPEQFDEAIQKALADNAEGLVIDLRGNPGGLLDTAQAMLSRFIDNKVMLRTKGRNEAEEVLRTRGGESFRLNLPIAILINSDSASASEIFAGVMQEYGLASLIGEHTYGKASVQDVIPLRDLSTAKVTIARYYLPSGRDISRRVDEEGRYVSGGLKPDVTTDLVIDENTLIGDPVHDSQLAEAIRHLKQKIQGSSSS